MTHRLIIVRHGNTFEAGQPLRRVGAATDMPLTAAGAAQAAAIGRAFAAQALSFDRVLTGPLQRTRATCAAICAALPHAPEPEVAAFLIEIDHGPDENALEAEVEARVGAAALAAWDRDGICPPGWHDDRAARLAAWRALAGQQGTTLLVTSNGAARFARLAYGLRGGSHKLRTGAWGIIDLTPDGDATLIAWDVRP